MRLRIPGIEPEGGQERLGHARERARIPEAEEEAAGHPRVGGGRVLPQGAVSRVEPARQHGLRRQAGILPPPVEEQPVTDGHPGEGGREARIEPQGALVLVDRPTHRARRPLCELVVRAQEAIVGSGIARWAARQRRPLDGAERAVSGVSKYRTATLEGAATRSGTTATLRAQRNPVWVSHARRSGRTARYAAVAFADGVSKAPPLMT